MSRLTKRWDMDAGNIAGRAVCEFRECPTGASCSTCHHAVVNNRLAEYEDKVPYARLDEAAVLLDWANDVKYLHPLERNELEKAMLCRGIDYETVQLIIRDFDNRLKQLLKTGF